MLVKIKVLETLDSEGLEAVGPTLKSSSSWHGRTESKHTLQQAGPSKIHTPKEIHGAHKPP